MSGLLRPSQSPGQPTRILCLSGPNLQLLGVRNPAVYGRTTLQEIHDALVLRGRALNVTVDCRQSNHEGELCDWIAEAREDVDGLLLNGGGLSHTSVSLRDAVEAIDIPTIEVHLSNPEAREPFRHHSFLSGVCRAKVAGFGAASYMVALDGLLTLLRAAG